MSGSHDAIMAVAKAFVGRPDISEDEIDRFFTETFPSMPEAKREAIYEFVVGATGKIEQADIDRFMAHLHAMGGTDTHVQGNGL